MDHGNTVAPSQSGGVESGPDVFHCLDQGAVGECCFAFLDESRRGKFGQWAGEWEERPDIIPPDDFMTWVEYDVVNNRRREFRSICWQTYEKVDRKEPAKSFPAVSAFVTAYGRHRMSNLIETAGKGEVLYIGTDALLVTERGYWALNTACEVAGLVLGKLKVERCGTSAELRGVNDYVIGKHRTRSGQKRSAVECGADSWHQYRFSGVAKWFDTVQGPQNTSQREQLTKLPQITKGKVGLGGWVEPFVLPQDKDQIAAPSGGAGSVISMTSSIRS